MSSHFEKMDEGVSALMEMAEEHKQVRQKMSDKIHKQMNGIKKNVSIGLLPGPRLFSVSQTASQQIKRAAGGTSQRTAQL